MDWFGPGAKYPAESVRASGANEVSRLMLVAAGKPSYSVGYAFRTLESGAWIAPTRGLPPGRHLFCYPSPLVEAHLDRAVGMDRRGHVVALDSSSDKRADGGVLLSRDIRVGGEPTYTLIPGASGPVRVLAPAIEASYEVEGMGTVLRLRAGGSELRRGQPLLSSSGDLLGVAVQSFDAKGHDAGFSVVVPVDVSPEVGKSIQIPSKVWDETLTRALGTTPPSLTGRLDGIILRMGELATHELVSELKELVEQHPSQSEPLRLLARAYVLRGEYAKAASADRQIVLNWPSTRVHGVVRAIEELRHAGDSVSDQAARVLAVKSSLARVPACPEVQDAALAGLCAVGAFEDACELAIGLDLARPAVLQDLRRVRAHLVLARNWEQLVSIQALICSASSNQHEERVELAGCYELVEDWPRALLEWHSIDMGEEPLPAFMLSVPRCLVETKEFGAAIEFMDARTSLARTSGRALCHALRARALLGAGKLQGAQEAIALIEQLPNVSTEVQVQLAMYYIAVGDEAAAHLIADSLNALRIPDADRINRELAKKWK